MSRRKKKSPLPNAKPPSPTPPQPWYTNAWVKVVAILGFLGWVLTNGPTAIDNSQILPAKVKNGYNSLVQWTHTDSSWTAKWSNEGDITYPVPYAFVDLDTFVYGDDVSGTISSTKFPASFPLEFMLIEGKKAPDNRITFQVYDYVSGVRVHFATMEAEAVKKNEVPWLHVKTRWQSAPMFPPDFELWRIGVSEMFQEEAK